MSEEFNERIFLLRELSERNLDAHFNHHIKVTEDDLIKNEKINMFYYMKLFEMKTLKIDRMISLGRQPDSGEDVLKQGEYAISHFLMNILSVAHELMIQHQVLNVSFEKDPVKDFLDAFNLKKFLAKSAEKGYGNYPVISLYHYMYLTAIEPDNMDNFLKFKETLFDNISFFSREEVFNLFIVFESICTTQISNGNKEFHRHNMELYKEMLDGNIYTFKKSDFFQVNLFRNVFYTALILKEIEWARKFVANHIHELHPDYRDDVIHLANAYIFFNENDFDKALDEISHVRFKYFVFKLDVRILTLKIHYDMNSTEQALSLIDSFQHFLNNNKSYEHYRESFGNFLTILKHLVKIKSGDVHLQADEIIVQINNTKILFNRDWLIEKAGELNVKKIR